MISKSTDGMQNGFVMTKVFIDNEKCLACGACALSCELIEEDKYGKAKVIEPGIVTDDALTLVQQVVDACPSKAISFTEHHSMVRNQGIAGLNEFKKVILEKLNNYSISMPEFDDYKFDKELFHFPWTEPWTKIMGTSYERTDYDGYRSERKAEREGLSEFNSVWYSRLRTLIQSILVDYKDRHLRRYYKYKEGDSWDFYRASNQEVEKLLSQIVSEAQYLANGKLQLPDGFEKFEVIPVFGEDNGRVYQLQHFEEIFITDNIMNQRESLSWYESYVNTSGWDKSYHYDLSEAVNSLEKWTLSDIASVVNNRVGEIIESSLNYFCEDVKKATKEKADILIKAIDNYITK